MPRPSHRCKQRAALNAASGARNTFIARQAIAKQSAERGIDEKTLEVRAIEVTSSSIGDPLMPPALLDQIPPDQEIESVTADRAYDTRKCYDAVVARNAIPVIPPRKNASLRKPDTPGCRARNEAVRSSIYLGRALRRHLTG